MVSPCPSGCRNGNERSPRAGSAAARRGEPMITALAARGYRSLHELVVPVGPLTVISGPNGAGKSNLYRAIRLLAHAAWGDLGRALAREGGMDAVRWAGPRVLSERMKRGEGDVEGQIPGRSVVRVQLGFASDHLGYAVDLGLPPPELTRFGRDPHLKSEVIFAGSKPVGKAVLVERKGPLASARSGRALEPIAHRLPPDESLLTEVLDRAAPEVLDVRDQLRSWRFYDQLRTDVDAPARRPQVGTRTWALANDGADLAAALLTIEERGDAEALHAAVSDAFPGARLEILGEMEGLETGLFQQGLLRPLRAAELSEGTLRYLLLVAALMSPRPPGLLVLNEPEASLHVDLLPALARRIVEASRDTQIVVVTHAPGLLAELLSTDDVVHLPLVRELGATRVDGYGPVDGPPWHWPPR